MVPQEVHHQDGHKPRVFARFPRRFAPAPALRALLQKQPHFLLSDPLSFLQQLPQRRARPATRHCPAARALLGFARLVGAVPHHDDERENVVCRRAGRGLSVVCVGRVGPGEGGAQQVGLGIDGAERAGRGLAEDGEGAIVEMVGRKLVWKREKEREEGTEKVGRDGVLEGGRGERAGGGEGDRGDAVLAVALEEGQHGAEGAEDRVLRGEEGIEKPSAKRWVVLADHWELESIEWGKRLTRSLQHFLYAEEGTDQKSWIEYLIEASTEKDNRLLPSSFD